MGCEVNTLEFAYIDCGPFVMKNLEMPEVGGTGIFGLIKRGNCFDIELPNPNQDVFIDGISITHGCTARAKTDNPGQDMTKWRLYY